MATVKQDGIVFEYPDDVELPEDQKAAVDRKSTRLNSSH